MIIQLQSMSMTIAPICHATQGQYMKQNNFDFWRINQNSYFLQLNSVILVWSVQRRKMPFKWVIFAIINCRWMELDGYFENRSLLLEWNGCKTLTKVGLSNRLNSGIFWIINIDVGKYCFAEINLRFQCEIATHWNVLLKMWKKNLSNDRKK